MVWALPPHSWEKKPLWHAQKLWKLSLANTINSTSFLRKKLVVGEPDLVCSQLKALENLPDHPSLRLLRDVIREFRDDELEHLDTAVNHNSQKAPAHAFLSTMIGGGCKIAIELCKRF